VNSDHIEAETEPDYGVTGDGQRLWPISQYGEHDGIPMVIGFVFFWPVGLVILYWIIRGRDVRDLPAAAREKWSQMFGRSKGGPSGNIVFEEYQQTQYDRIREIKEEIRERGRRFADFREDAKRRADQEEFNQFMASSPATNGQ